MSAFIRTRPGLRKPQAQKQAEMTRRVIEAEFDAKASVYESNRLSAWYKAQGAVVLRHLPHASAPVVDVGCGTGWLLRQIMKHNQDVIGIGVDVSARMVAAAQERTTAKQRERVIFIHGDWEDMDTRERVLARLDWPPATIVCVSALHYFRDPVVVVRGMYEMLAPGGSILLLDRAMDRSVGTFVWDMIHRYVIKDEARFYRTDDLVALLERAGCDNVRVLERINRLFWAGKFHTSLTLVTGTRPEQDAPEE